MNSEKYKLNIREILKGLIIASLVSALTVIQQIADKIIFSGVFVMPDYKVICMAGVSGGCMYLLKKFLTDGGSNKNGNSN